MGLSFDLEIFKPGQTQAVRSVAKASEDLTKQISALETKEKKIDSLMHKYGASTKLVNEFHKQISAKKTSLIKKQATELVEGKKKNVEDKKQLGWVKSITREYLFVRDAAKLAFGTIKKLTVDLMGLGKEALDAQTASLYEFNQWAGDNQGAKQMAAVDHIAHKLGMTLEEARGQFLKFRKASDEPLFVINNADAMRLVKLRADIAAVSKSTRVADEEMDRLLSLVNQPAAFAKFEAQLRKTPESFKKFGEIGSGAIAEALSPKSVDAGKKKIEDAVKGIGLKFWEKIGPTIGDAANKLGDFIGKFQNSKEFAVILKDITDSFKWLAEKGIPAVIDWIKKFAEAWVGMKDLTSQDVKRYTKDTFDSFTEPARKLFKDVFGSPDEWKRAMDRIVPGPATIMPPSTPAPAPGKQGALQRNAGTQLASIVIENINVQGGGSAQENARAVRQELQLLLRAGDLSQGLG
jgi:hypothetical protein